MKKCRLCGEKCSGTQCRQCFANEKTAEFNVVETDRRGLEGVDALAEYRQCDYEDRSSGGWINE